MKVQIPAACVFSNLGDYFLSFVFQMNDREKDAGLPQNVHFDLSKMMLCESACTFLLSANPKAVITVGKSALCENLFILSLNGKEERWRRKIKCLQVIGSTLKAKEDREKIADWEEEKRKRGREGRGQTSEQGFCSAAGVRENATNNEMSILPTSSLSLALLRLFSSGPHYQCT